MSAEPGNLSDVFGTKELLEVVVKKLSSQALLFSLAVIAALVVTRWFFGSQALLLTGLIVFVFLVGTAGYLFVETRNKLAEGDPATVTKLVEKRAQSIVNPEVGELRVKVWVTLAEAAATARDVAVAPREAGFKLGQKINLHVSASKDSYLTLLNIGTSGKLTVLFPNSLHPDSALKADQIHSIPGAEYGFDYVLQGPPGLEKIKAIVTLEPVALLDSQLAADGSLFRSVGPSAAARDVTVVKKRIAAVTPSTWAEAATEFRVTA